MCARQLILALISFATLGGQSPSLGQAAASGSFHSAMGSYAATVETREYAAGDGIGWWGSDGTPPERVCSGILVSYKGKPVHVPRSAYSDLSSIHKVEFTRAAGDPKLLIVGGDAGTGYHCYLVFNRGRIVRRRVEDGEFPANFFEVTGYTAKAVRD
jgi:hypothetical protein